MRLAVLVLTFVLVSGLNAMAQEPPPLPHVRPDTPADGDSEAQAEAGDEAAGEVGSDDDQAAMPELAPLIPVEAPAEDEDEDETAEVVPSDDRTTGPPLPQPKPETPVEKAVDPEAGPDSVSDKPLPTIAEAPKQAKPKYDLNEARQCEAALREYAATFEVADPIKGEGQCGWPRPLRLKSLSRDVKIRGNIQVRCEVGLALARWAKEVVVPSGKLHMGQQPVAVEISTSYQCRRRNNGSTGKISEHGFANGIDLMAVHFEDGKRVAVADRRGSSEGDRAFQAAIRGGACAYFTTVLGPVADANHANHFHLDLAVRRGGYRLCQ